jgi:tRNA(Ser,Leu) C12 N-acetylase TAN1
MAMNSRPTVPTSRDDVPKGRQAPKRTEGCSTLPTEAWNAIVTARGDRLPKARKGLRELGRVQRTGFYNVLTVTVDEPQSFLERFEQLSTEHPELAGAVAHVFPAQRSFDFSSPAEFESKARDTALTWVPQLAGKTFHVRAHRRGRKGTLASPKAERAIADTLLAAIAVTGQPARVSFDDPDAIVLIETIGGRAGVALLTRDDYRQHPLLATQ